MWEAFDFLTSARKEVHNTFFVLLGAISKHLEQCLVKNGHPKTIAEVSLFETSRIQNSAADDKKFTPDESIGRTEGKWSAGIVGLEIGSELGIWVILLGD